MTDLSYHPLVDTTWLAEHLADPALRVVDARWRGDGSGQQRYLAGHISGAVHLDWHADLAYTAGGIPDLLLPPGDFAAVMAAAGIGDHTRVVVYADTNYSGATRLWWALNYYGHDQVAVLDGGLTKWQAESRPLSAELPHCPPAAFTPHPQPRWLATAADVERALAGPDAGTCLVDSRPPEQYAGRAVWTPAGSLYLPPGQESVEVAGQPIRGGRIPGARHLHAERNLDPAHYWTYLDPEAIRRQALALGIRPENRIITYCGVGISASLALFA
ncbi:MAG: hypothetical protein L0332_15050, partial [Chloroflexi bacterium]|nr:hypothetical protein [Chloroflexota bacterium]